MIPLLLSAALAARGAHVSPLTGSAERWALVYGVDDPPTVAGGLTDAEASAVLIADRLSAAGFHHVTWRTGEDATREEVTAWMAALAGRLGPDDTVMVVGVSHGAVCDEPVAGTQHLRLYGATDGARCFQGGVSDLELLAGLRDTRAGTRLLVLDACMTAFGSMGPAPVARDPLAGHRDDGAVLRSTARGLSAFQRGGRVVYARLLAAALEGAGGTFTADLDADGAVTVDELHRHLQAALEATRRADPTLEQLPSLDLFGVRDSADLVVVGTPSAPRRAVLTWVAPPGPGALVPLGPLATSPWDGGALVQRDALGISARVFGVSARPGTRDGRPLLAGRRRGAPSLRLWGGGGWAWGFGPPLDEPAPWRAGGGITLHALPWLAISLGGEGNDRLGLGWLAVDGALHWRRLTWTLGPRLSVLGLPGGPDVVAGRVALGVGGGLGFRAGIGGPLAWTLDLTADVTGRRADGQPAGVLVLGGLTSGLLLDLGLLR